MADIIQFTPRAQWTAEENLADFIEKCRFTLTAFGADLPFDEDIWDISGSIQLKGRTTTARAVFSSLQAAKANQSSPTMAAEFQVFAKAYFRYMHALRPTTSYPQRLSALRLVDAALTESGRGGRVTAITHDILDRACGLAVEHYSPEVAAKTAGQIQLLADFLLEAGLVEMKAKWVKSIKKPRQINLRVGKEADAARQKLMPSVAAIEAMAHVFVHAQEPTEKYIGATLALLHCAPQRINETVRLTVDCEVESKDTKGALQFGLRWPGSKGFENSVKWILPSMAEVAQKAIRMLKEVSAEARAIARWYDEHPTQIYLHPRIEHLRTTKWLRLEEVSLILFGDENVKNASGWCTREGLIRQDGMVAFDDVQDRVLKKLPKGFPYAQPGLRYSDALFVVRRFELDAKLRTYRCLVDYLSSDQIAARIGRSGSAVNTVFDRFGLTEDNGSPIELSSHQVRHYLNTLAQANGVSQLDIAMWSGRADVRQNKAYDHVTPDRILSKAREVATTSGSQLFGGDLNTPKVRVLARRDDDGRLITGSAHITDYGMCTHDYAMSPCQIHRDCLNCNELVCVKGDTVKTENLRRLKGKTEELLQKAEAAERAETYGASRWVEHQRRTLAHCTQLLSILENPAVPEGAAIQLTGVQPASRLEQAKAQREGQQPALPARRNLLLERIKRG